MATRPSNWMKGQGLGMAGDRSDWGGEGRVARGDRGGNGHGGI